MKQIDRRRRGIGLAAAALWLTSAGAFVVIWSLLAIDPPGATQALVVALAIVAALMLSGLRALRAALRLQIRHARTPEVDRMIRRFAWVFGAETVAFAVVNPLLTTTRHFDAMPAANLIIVGLHFIPLAWIFRVPRYYPLGFLFCAISITTLLAVPHGTILGHALGRYVIPTLGCGVVALVISAANIGETWRLVHSDASADVVSV